MSRTVITGPDGSVTTIRHQSGCGGCVSGVFWFVVGAWVLVAPAYYFPLWGAVLAYIVEAAVAAAALGVAVQRRQRSS